MADSESRRSAAPVVTFDLRAKARAAGLGAAFLLAVTACATPPGPDRALLVVTAGAIEVFDHHPAKTAGLEYRFHSDNRFQVVPILGMILSEGAALFLYGELRRNFWIDQDWVFSPRAGYGFFQESAEIDLGAELEFRTGIELERRLPHGMRVGIGLFHISNAGISRTNPGTEALVLSFGIPVGK